MGRHQPADTSNPEIHVASSTGGHRRTPLSFPVGARCAWLQEARPSWRSRRDARASALRVTRGPISAEGLTLDRGLRVHAGHTGIARRMRSARHLAINGNRRATCFRAPGPAHRPFNELSSCWFYLIRPASDSRFLVIRGGVHGRSSKMARGCPRGPPPLTVPGRAVAVGDPVGRILAPTPAETTGRRAHNERPKGSAGRAIERAAAVGSSTVDLGKHCGIFARERAAEGDLGTSFGLLPQSRVVFLRSIFLVPLPGDDLTGRRPSLALVFSILRLIRVKMFSPDDPGVIATVLQAGFVPSPPPAPIMSRPRSSAFPGGWHKGPTDKLLDRGPPPPNSVPGLRPPFTPTPAVARSRRTLALGLAGEAGRRAETQP